MRWGGEAVPKRSISVLASVAKCPTVMRSRGAYGAASAPQENPGKSDCDKGERRRLAQTPSVRMWAPDPVLVPPSTLDASGTRTMVHVAFKSVGVAVTGAPSRVRV